MTTKEKTWKIYRYWIIIDGEEWNYTGQSSSKYRSHRAGNLKTGVGYKDQPKFWAAIQKYGFENFNYEVIWETKDPKEADYLEKMTIELLNSVEHGFNENYGRENSDQTKRKMSEAKKGLPGYSHPFSEEHKKKMAESKGVFGILQYDKQGNLLAEYPSTMEAERQTGVPQSNIIACCKGRYKSAGGYVWRYKTTNFI